MIPSNLSSSRRKIAERSDDAEPSLPHDHKREGRQPYASEVDDYEHGVASPSDQQVGKEADRTKKRRS